ncbi:MAG: hypothetical protein ACRC7V_05150 [Lachnospiraceae bacterium]
MKGEYYKYDDMLELNEVINGDEYLAFVENTDEPLFEDLDFVWELFEKWLISITEMHAKEKESVSYKLGIQILFWCDKKDVYGIRFVIKNHFSIFKHCYLTHKRPEIVNEFLKCIGIFSCE